MNEKEIKEKIERLEQDKFYLAMKDRWSADDYVMDRKYASEIRKLREMLKEV